MKIAKMYTWDTPQNLGTGKLQPKICRAVLQFHQVRFHSLAISRSLSGVVGSFRELSGVVGSCRELLGVVGSCREFVGTCRDLSGNVDFMESHFEGIAIVVDKISAEFPIPEILRSVPASHHSVDPVVWNLRMDERCSVSYCICSA